jgi:tetratricopeptide (TPR) repeat protein
LDKAIQSYNRVINKNPDNNNNNNNTTTQLLYNKALFLLNSGARNRIEALKCCDKIIEINPKMFRLINPNYISRAYFKYYDKAIEINNSNYGRGSQSMQRIYMSGTVEPVFFSC